MRKEVMLFDYNSEYAGDCPIAYATVDCGRNGNVHEYRQGSYTADCFFVIERYSINRDCTGRGKLRIIGT